MNYIKLTLEDLLSENSIHLTFDEIATLRKKILENKQQFMDLVIWGEHYTDEEGNRIDPLTINKSI